MTVRVFLMSLIAVLAINTASASGVCTNTALASLAQELLEESDVSGYTSIAVEIPEYIKSMDLPSASTCANSSANSATNAPSVLGSYAGRALAVAIVGFYRYGVGPAIGSRCALEPSCSRYYLDASRKHGLLGIPLLADRFVREPVASASPKLVMTKSGELRHPDPVEDHDFWFVSGKNDK